MATVNVRNITLSQTAVLGSKKQELSVTQVGVRYLRDPETRKATAEIEGYYLNVRSPKTGEIQTVKLPLDVADQYTQIKEALTTDQQVIVSFHGTFRGRFWAMLGDNGRVNMGISATASELEIIRIESVDDEFLDDEIIM